MEITKITSHILQYDMPQTLGYSQQFYDKRTAHLIEVETDEGLTGWGECFGPGNIALANRTIVQDVIQSMILGHSPLDRDVLWHKTYNLMRDHGQKGMPMQALSGVDIALWDIAGKVANLPIYQLIGGAHRKQIPVYGYGMMLRPEPLENLTARFKEEARAIKDMGFVATKIKVGLGPRAAIKLAEAVRSGIGDDFRFMVDANHCYTTSDAFTVGRALEDLGAYWFEEPIAPEDLQGYRELRAGLNVNISGGEVEFSRWGWRSLLESRGLDIAKPEVCALGGISEYLQVLALCHAHFTPVVNHVWGSAVAVATNMHLLASLPDLPGGMNPWKPMLEFDTTDNKFRDELLETPLEIQAQVAQTNGYLALPEGPGLGITPDRDFLQYFAL
jgi:D-galactarolactone cycloisomerase